MYTRAISVFLFALAIASVECFAPPHPDFKEEYDRDRRRRLLNRNSTLPQLQLLSPELCHRLSDDECRLRDQLFIRHATKVRKLLDTTKTLKTLVLCIRFQDHADRVLPSRDDIELLWSAKAGEANTTLVPTGSIRAFLKQNSNGKFLLDVTVKGWFSTDNTEAYYSFDVSGRDDRLQQMMNPVLDSLESMGEDFSQFDQDGDGVLDSVVVMHSGYPAESGNRDCYNQPYQNRIWSHAVPVYGDNGGWISSDRKYRLGTYVVASALRPPSYSKTCFRKMARIGVVTHEFIHTLGLPDLYETTSDGQVGYGTGFFDIMSQPFGVDGKQTHPSNLSPWSKKRLGWLDPIEITQDGEYYIEASELGPNIYIIRSPYPADEYLLIENRQPIGYDELLFNGGLLIWHIDDNVEDNNHAGFPGLSGWPGNGYHYRVAVLAADRSFDLERGMNEGDDGDFWTAGDELSPGPTDSTVVYYSKYPNTNSYSGLVTGLRIYDISPSQTVMSFKVEGLPPAAPPSPRPSEAPTPFPTSHPTWRPSVSPTPKPSYAPTHTPSRKPTRLPTENPTPSPSISPSAALKQESGAIPIAEQPNLTPTILPVGVAIQPSIPDSLGSPTNPPASSGRALMYRLAALVCVAAGHLLW